MKYEGTQFCRCCLRLLITHNWESHFFQSARMCNFTDICKYMAGWGHLFNDKQKSVKFDERYCFYIKDDRK